MRPKFVLEKAGEEGLALTFDDVRLRTGHSRVMPDDVNLGSKFSRNINLKIPIVSAAMDTVTEYKLAIEIAKLGGIGIIHRNLSPDEQASQVAKVKHHLNGLIEKPICINEDDVVGNVLRKKDEKGWGFLSFIVTDSNGKITGLVTNDNFKFCIDDSRKIKEIMTSDLLVVSPGTTIDEAYEIMIKSKKSILPVVNSNREPVGLYTWTDVKRIKSGIAVYYNTDSRGQLIVGAAIGVGNEALERVRKLAEKNVDVIVIDTAHGDTESVVKTLKEIKNMFPSLDVVVGNVSTGESAMRLAETGADGIKVGQGPGSICTTRIIAGIGRPQVSAVYDCAKAVAKYGIPICANGGLRNSGDIPIAIAAGAHSVMMGSMLAGTDESPGEKIFFLGIPWKMYRGMGSIGAMESSKSSRERYLQMDKEKNKLVPEGIEGRVPYKGKLKDVIFQYVGGLRRGMSYVGAASIDELREKGNFDRITQAGFAESHPHDVELTEDSPNYVKGKS